MRIVIVMSEASLWKPLTLQDDTLFRDINLNESQALDIINMVEKTEAMDGVCVLNFHPHIIRFKTKFYENFLRYIS